MTALDFVLILVLIALVMRSLYHLLQRKSSGCCDGCADCRIAESSACVKGLHQES